MNQSPGTRPGSSDGIQRIFQFWKLCRIQAVTGHLLIGTFGISGAVLELVVIPGWVATADAKFGLLKS